MANIVSTEPLEATEVIFIIKRYHKASKDYMRVMNLILLSTGILPLVVASMFWLYDTAIEVVIQIFFFLLFALIAFFIVVAVIFYFLQIFNKYRDAVYKTKKIENCLILDKKFVPVNQTYHFFINSKVQYSIELPENIYNMYDIGDEINIEYSTYDKEYLGYF